MEFFATCPKGFEQLLAHELTAIGCAQVRPLKGQVSFAGELKDAYSACLWSRLASRIILVLARVDAASSDTLYEGVRALPWQDHLSQGSSLMVDAHGTNAELRNTRFVALRCKDAITDHLLAQRGTRPLVDVENPDVTVSVRVSRTRATVGIDLSGTPLFKRGYEVLPGRRAPIAPLRPDYASALLCLGGWKQACEQVQAAGRTPALVVAYPGAGTLLVEAAAMALDHAPGLSRHRWGFTGWGLHDPQVWESLLAEARARADQDASHVSLWAHETRSGAEPACRQMLGSAGIPAAPQWHAQAQAADLVACDLSWVTRDEPATQADALARVSSVVSALPDARVSALALDTVVDAAVRRSPETVLDVIVGRDEASMRTYDAAEGADSVTTVRIHDEDVPIYVSTSDQYAARLMKVAKQRAKWARREDVTCYRVYDADLPDYAVTVDLFTESLETARETPRMWLQLYEYAAPRDIDTDLARKRLLDVLAITPRVLGVHPRNVFLRTRTKARGGSQYADEATTHKGGRARMVAGAELPAGAHLIDEGGLCFEVNFSTRLDCGIFLDHRDTRAMLREMAKDTAGSKRFLNLFAYTGTATCYAADGGAKHTTTVDLSRPSLEWARRNMERNGFTGRAHEFVQADVLQWVSEQRRTANRWDLVFCDVPTFSNSQRMRKGSFDVQRDHVELLIGVSRLLTRGSDGRDGGTCVFSCNLRTFKPDVAALAKAGVIIEDITEQTIPEDFSRNRRIHHCYVVRRG